MEGVAGVADLSVEQQTDVPILRAHFDRNAIARHGLTVREVAQTMEAAIKGVTVSRVLEGRNSFDLVVRLAEPEGWRLEDIGDLLVDTLAGAKVPLKSLAEIRKETGPNYISREQVERKIVVVCNAAGRDVTSIVNDCKKVVDPLVAEMPGYRVEYGGQFESAAEAGRIIALLGVAVVIGIGFLLHLAFGSARDAALIMLNLPLALIPLALGGHKPGSEIQTPMAIVILFGLLTSMLLNLIVVPALYLRFGRPVEVE